MYCYCYVTLRDHCRSQSSSDNMPDCHVWDPRITSRCGHYFVLVTLLSAWVDLAFCATVMYQHSGWVIIINGDDWHEQWQTDDPSQWPWLAGQLPLGLSLY